jgi:hypothetical protein
MQKIKSVLSLGENHQVRNGRPTRFWLDWWQGSGPLQDRFPILCVIVADPHDTVAEYMSSAELLIPLRRGMGARERNELASLLFVVAEVRLPEGQDKLSWALEPSGKFSVKSLCWQLCRGHLGNTFVRFRRLRCP